MRSVLPEKMTIGGKIPLHATMVRKSVTYLLSQPDVLTVTDLELFFVNYSLGYISKKTGVSSMLPKTARGYFRIFKNLAHISYKPGNFSSYCLESFWVIEVRLRSASP